MLRQPISPRFSPPFFSLWTDSPRVHPPIRVTADLQGGCHLTAAHVTTSPVSIDRQPMLPPIHVAADLQGRWRLDDLAALPSGPSHCIGLIFPPAFSLDRDYD